MLDGEKLFLPLSDGARANEFKILIEAQHVIEIAARVFQVLRPSLESLHGGKYRTARISHDTIAQLLKFGCAHFLVW